MYRAVLLICLTVLIPAVVTHWIPYEECQNDTGVSVIRNFEIQHCDRVENNTTCAFSGGKQYPILLEFIAAHNCSNVCVDVSVRYKGFEVRLSAFRRCVCDQLGCPVVSGQLYKILYIAQIPDTSFRLSGYVKPRVVCIDDHHKYKKPLVMVCYAFQFRLN